MVSLNLRFNQLKEVPLELAQLRDGALKEIELAGNPLIHPPADVCAAGCASVLQWLHSEQSGTALQ